MDEAVRVLERLRRIRDLDRSRAPATAILDELRELVHEAEAWARLEGDERAVGAATALAGAVGRRGEPGCATAGAARVREA